MANFLIDLSEETRLKITLVSSILSLICIIPSAMLLGAGAYIQGAVQTKVHLTEDLNTTVLPSCIITIGFLCMCHNCFCGTVVFLSRNKKKREDLIKFLFPTVIIGLVLCLAIFAAGIMCFVQITHLSSSLQKGISAAMKKYKSDPAMKQEIDTVQIEFECCGNDKYTDWFSVSWIHSDYLTAERAVLNYINDDVPFSCCNPASPRPCIHHDIHNNKLHYNYDYRVKTTLHNVGCRHALDNFYGWGLLTNVGALVVCISILQTVVSFHWILFKETMERYPKTGRPYNSRDQNQWNTIFAKGIAVILTRIVQTSMATAYENGDLFGPATAYIFWCGPSTDDEHKHLEEPLLDDDDDLSWGSDFQDDDHHYEVPQNEGKISPEVHSDSSSEHIYHAIEFNRSSTRKLQSTADNSNHPPTTHLPTGVPIPEPSSFAPPVPAPRKLSPSVSRPTSPVRVPSSPSTPRTLLDISPRRDHASSSRHSHSRLIPSLRNPILSTM